MIDKLKQDVFDKKDKTLVQKFKQLKKFNKKTLDKMFHEKHEEVFSDLDCLDCANCCKTTSPIFRDIDIKRIAKSLKIKEVEFINNYLKKDADNDYVLQSSPCFFLEEDNTCRIYDVRPQACREYPHTDRKNMFQILNLTKRNASVCPAVGRIIKEL